jgi:glutamine synthetase
MKIRLEYVWLDGYQPEPNLRSKVKIVDYESIKNSLALGVNKLPMWNFDGSSTKQAETGDSDRLLKPVRMYTSKVFPVELKTVYVLCEVLNPDGTPHKTNTRSKLNEEQEDLWLGFEQEYFIREEINGSILGHKRNILKGQGEYYCGVGHNVVGRDFVEKHTDMCLEYGIDITGTNAEVALGQWEYQVFSKGKLKGGDDLWMSRYFLYKISEEYGYHIELHPKPLTHGEWNGSGLHTNFSTEVMREGDLNMTLWEREQYFKSIFSSFESRHLEHIKNYGSQNDLRLTGEYETQSIDKFSWGISDRGASIRVPQSTADNWTGYLEDRRPGSNADPYKIVYQIMESIKNAVAIYKIKLKMNFDGDGSKYKDKFTGIIPNDELLSEYRNDDDYEMGDLMNGSKNNVKPQVGVDVVQEYLDSKENKVVNPLPEELKKTMMNANQNR